MVNQEVVIGLDALNNLTVGQAGEHSLFLSENKIQSDIITNDNLQDRSGNKLNTSQGVYTNNHRFSPSLIPADFLLKLCEYSVWKLNNPRAIWAEELLEEV